MGIKSKRYSVVMEGKTPFLSHKDNITWGEKVRAWSKHPENKKKSVAGDDRSPAWTWLGYCYDDSITGLMVIESDNLMAMLRDAGKKCPAATGKGSLKAQTQSGILVDQFGWPIEVDGGKTINIREITERLADVEDFEKHEQAAVEAGFELFVKRAKIGTSKHVRVRPRFDVWTARGTITVADETITLETLRNLFQVAGTYVGVGDWRPGSPASGRFGTFIAKVNEI